MMPFGDCLFFFFFLGSGLKRGQSPVEWEKILSIRLYVLLSIPPSVHLSILPSVYPSIHPWTCQRFLRASCMGLRANLRGLRGLRGLRASWRALRASWKGLRANQKGLRASQKGLRASQGGTYVCTDVWTNRWTYVQNFSPFYKTLSPLGAAAQKGGERG